VQRATQLLCLSGHDPTGGAGIQADIEAAAAVGVHALGVITAHTVQDTSDVERVSAVAPILLAAQLDALLADCSPSAAKIGLLGDAAQVGVVAERLRRLGVPLIIDPVLRAGGGRNLVGAELKAELLQNLFPLAELITPNAQEARLLAGVADLQRCGRALLDLGPRHVLITGGDEPGAEVADLLFGPGQIVQRFSSARLPQSFHGAGCTLAASIAALRALGRPLPEAIEQARRYTHTALAHALVIGNGRRIPRRLVGQR
jgi:hydroxymethylpyrimidine/phosphomethylpyrimidine kinase